MYAIRSYYGDANFDNTHVYKINGSNEPLKYANSLLNRDRDWYFETSFRYNRKFEHHNVGALLLYNQSKTYYPKQFTQIPSGYIGLVGRLTYDYRSKYIAEFNIGRNGSENFAPGKRYGILRPESYRTRCDGRSGDSGRGQRDQKVWCRR